ncbi:hypothetical protein AB4Y42_43470 [Paraburkholderia sp. EG286B]|uniref:hypothetical protein n=1 Tax=Paraburkholderia sp. EG286B TaxID=3237011 RepID=UPI0034D1C589
MLHPRITRVALGASVCVALAACGGGGGGSSTAVGGNSPPATSNAQITGKAIDGYLSGATVCFDNGQGACDLSQPTTTTDANGNYTLKVSGDATGKQIDVLVTPTTVDRSNPSGAPFTTTFTLSAIVSGATQNVTPLTTMVVAQMNAGKSQDQATQAVQNLVGSSVDPGADYIANGDSNTTGVAADMVGHLEALYGNGPVSWTLVQATMNAYAAVGNVEGVQQSDVNTQLSNMALSQPIAATAALADSLYAVDGDLIQESSTGAVVSPGLSPVRENWTLSGSTLSITQEVQSSGAWSAASPVGSYDGWFSGNFIQNTAGLGAMLMKTDGTWTNWFPNSQLHPAYALSSVGNNLVGTDPNTGDAITASYRTIDVSGQPLSTALQIDYRNPVRGSMSGTFPTGTTAYLASTQHANDQLMLTESGIGTAQSGSWSASYSPGTGVYWSSLSDPTQTLTSVQQVVGTQIQVDGPCLLLHIEAGGVAQIVESGASGCNYANEPISFPVAGSWSVYPRNPNVITISLPKSVGGATVPITDTIKNTINAGGSLVVALVNGVLLSGYMLPASSVSTVQQFPATVTDTIAAAMRAAATNIGETQNP